MKNDHWVSLESVLRKHGFCADSRAPHEPATSWFVGEPIGAEALTTHLRFVFKPKLHVLTAHVGWRHEATHRFCMEALRVDWLAGFNWLSEAGLIQSPCLLLFNLSNYMEWPLAGLPVGGSDAVRESSEGRLANAMSRAQWNGVSAQWLLDHYLSDQSPFNWGNANAALRIAHIAGLVTTLKSDISLFDRCVAEHLSKIQADMFSLGSATTWIQALRSRSKAG